MSITQGLHRSLQIDPSATAVTCQGRVRTFEEHAERIARLGAGFRGLGGAPGDRIAIVSLNSDRYLEFLLACSWIGAVFSPLNTRWSATEAEFGVNDAGSRVLVVDETFAPLADKLRALCPSVEHVVYLGDSGCPKTMVSFEELIEGGEVIEDLHVDDATVAGVFYTGGTTGFSRGVVLTHANLKASAIGSLACGDILAPGPMLHVAPLFHLAGIWPWLIQLFSGGAHVVLPTFDPAQVVSAVNDHMVTNVFMVPTMVHRFLEHLSSAQATVPSLQRLLYAGSPIPEAVLDRLQRQLSEVGLCQVYGMTELAPVATVLLPDDHYGAHRTSAGRAAIHSVVKAESVDGKDCQRGEVGQILVRGDCVMQGYWNRPEETAAALAGGWMHTGDAGYLDEDGFLFVVDRIKDMIVTGGENVYSVEVENALSSHPAVFTCAVIGVPDDQWGECVHAVIVPVEGSTVELEELRAHVSKRIARYKAPRSMELVPALPVSAAGKVLKRELRAHVARSGETS